MLKLCSFAQNNFYFDSTNIQLKPLNINTEESEFGPYKIGNTLYYTSSQERKIGVINMEASTLHQMLDLYSGTLSDSITVKKVKALTDKINNPLNQGSCFFDRESSKLYYSTDIKIPGSGVKEKHKLAIYSSLLKNNVFETPKPEMVLADTFSASHPMIYDHKLYFSANLPGGKGKTDIYIAEYKDSTWKIFTNYTSINTEENEYFPFAVSENEIYYSSTQTGGYGGLDIYKCTIDSGNAVIQNLGSPINTKYDDFGIYIDSLEENGYFSTSRNENQDDIFFFTKTWPSFKNCVEQVKEDYCYNLSEESTLNTDSLKGYYYEWLFGDGTKQKGLEVRHCFIGPGNYLINLNVVDSTTKQVFMTQASFDLAVDSIVQLKINSLDTVLVDREFNINTIGTFLPDKKITGYFYEIEGKRIRGRSIEHTFEELGSHVVKLGITYTQKGSTKKQLMCTTKNIVAVNAQVWAGVEKRKIAEEVLKYGSSKFKSDSSALAAINYDDVSMNYTKSGLNGKKVADGIKTYVEDRNKTGNAPVELSGSSTAFSLKYKYMKGDIDTLFDLKEGDGVTFKVHLGKSKNLKDTTAISANGITGINQQLINGEYQYTYGDEKKINAIEKSYKNVLNAGVENPVVIAYKNGQIIEDQSKNIKDATFYEDKSKIKPKAVTASTATTEATASNNAKENSSNTNENSNAADNNLKNNAADNSQGNKTSNDNNAANPTKENNTVLASNNNSENQNSNSNETTNSEKNSKNTPKEKVSKNKHSNKKENNNSNTYHENSSDSNSDVSTATNEINEAMSGDADFIPKTDIQKKIMLYLKKYGDISAKDLEFKVQVGVYRHRKRYHFPKLSGLGEVESESLEDGLTRMTIGGSFKTLKEAFELNKKVFKRGHEDAFVSVYYKGKRIYIENLEKRGVINKKGEALASDNETVINENNLIEKTERKTKKAPKEKAAENDVLAESAPAKEYDTKDFVPTTVVQRKTMAYIEKYGDMAVEGVEYKVQIALFKYRKDWDFPRLNKLGLGVIEKAGIENGITRMTIGGSYKTLREAFEQNKKVIMAGQTDAFVCIFYHGKRIYMENLEKKGVFTTK